MINFSRDLFLITTKFVVSEWRVIRVLKFMLILMLIRIFDALNRNQKRAWKISQISLSQRICQWNKNKNWDNLSIWIYAIFMYMSASWYDVGKREKSPPLRSFFYLYWNMLCDKFMQAESKSNVGISFHFVNKFSD